MVSMDQGKIQGTTFKNTVENRYNDGRMMKFGTRKGNNDE